MADIEAQLKSHLENAKDWEKMETPIPGVFVVKVPATKTRGPLLNVEINPVKEDGSPMKRKGLFVRNYEMFIKFREALEDDKLTVLLKEIDNVNPDSSNGKGGTKKLKM